MTAGETKIAFYSFSGLASLFSAGGESASSVMGDVLHDDADAAVGGIEGIVGGAEVLIGKSADLDDLVGCQATLFHQAAGGVGAVSGELPIAVIAGAGVGLGIGVAFDRHFVGQLA